MLGSKCPHAAEGTDQSLSPMFTCSDYEGKRAGEGGRTITGDVEQYPSRTSLTGGFAGGEAGLQQFLEEGEVKFKDPNEGKPSPQL